MALPHLHPLWKILRALSGAAGAGALAAAGFLLLLLRDPLLCWNDDFALSILPALADVGRAWDEGAWPLLSPYCWGCGNLAGEYQYGTFSVFVNAVVVAVWEFHPSYPAAAAAISAAHLFVLAAGAFLLGRKRGLSVPPATLVALIGALNGWNVCWGATDWFGAIAALAWLPWAWWALEVALDARGPDWRWLLPVPFIYLLVAGGFPYTVVMLAAVTIWLALREGLALRRRGAIWPLGLGWTLGLGLSAPAWLSLLEYMQGSGRSAGEDLYHNAWVVPFHALPGLVLPSWRTAWPNFLGNPAPHAAIELTGALVPLAALAAANWRKLMANRMLRWDSFLTLTALGLCFLPSAGVFRWSFRWLPFFHLAFALTGAQALQLAAEAQAPRSWRRNPGLLASGIIALIWVFMVVSRARVPSSGDALLPMLTLGIALAWGLGEATHVPKMVQRWLPAVAAGAGMLAAYLCLPLNPEVPHYPFTGNLAKSEPLLTDRLYLSLYRAPYHHYFGSLVPKGFGAVLRMGNTAMFSGVHVINGYSPIHPSGVGRRFMLETHGQPDPDRAIDALEHEAGPDGLLARLGVDGLLVARDFPLPSSLPPEAQWERVFESSEGTIYHRRGKPLAEVCAWESREPGAAREFAPARVRLIKNARQRMAVDVAASSGRREPILLAFRRPWFPGYRATLNGLPLRVGSYQGLLPTVELPAGASGQVTLDYFPHAVKWGTALALASFSFICVSMIWLWRRGARREEGTINRM